MSLQDYILGMDIGGTNTRMGLVNRKYQVSNVEVIRTKTIYSKNNTVLNLIEIIQDYCNRNLDGKKPVMISAGFPSVVDRERKHLYSSTNLPGLDGVNIVDVMSEALEIPVIIQHDAYYLLAYDIYDNQIKNEGTLIGFYFGTGMGNGMFINGEPYVGKNGTACEVGHMPVALSSEPCSCGNKGCIEMFCCGKAFEKLINKNFPDTPIDEIFEKHSDEKVLDDFVRYMAVPVATEVNILDPEFVFIGGGLVQMKGFPKEKLVEYILDNTRKPYPAANLQLIFSKDSPENGIIGAGIEGFRYLK